MSGPQIKSVGYTPSSVDVSTSSKTVTFTMHVTDSRNVTNVFADFSNGSEIVSGYMQLISGTAQDGVWQHTYTIPQGAAPGDWNYGGEVFDSLTTMFYNSNGHENLPPGAPGPLIVTDSNPMSGPQIASVGYTPSSVDVSTSSKTVTFTMHVTDSRNVTNVFADFSNGSEIVSGYMQLISGTAQDGVWQHTYTIPQGAAPGDWNYGGEVFDSLTTMFYNSNGHENLPPGAPGPLIVTEGPGAPVIASPASGTTTGTSTIPIVGTADPGDDITLYDGGTQVGTTTADSFRGLADHPHEGRRRAARLHRDRDRPGRQHQRTVQPGRGDGRCP